MPTKNLHDKPFDESTIIKLEIFEDYAQAWIPTFVMQNAGTICIFDFFAGTGYDKNGVPGSPIRILEKVKEQVIEIFRRKVKVKIFFNEIKSDKIELLKNACVEYLKINDHVGRAVEIEYYNRPLAKLNSECLEFKVVDA